MNLINLQTELIVTFLKYNIVLLGILYRTRNDIDFLLKDSIFCNLHLEKHLQSFYL